MLLSQFYIKIIGNLELKSSQLNDIIGSVVIRRQTDLVDGGLLHSLNHINKRSEDSHTNLFIVVLN